MIASQSLEQDLALCPTIKNPMEAILCTSMLTAYLLVGDVMEAEKVVMKAIQLWSAEEDDTEQLLQITVNAAALRAVALSSTLIDTVTSDYKLPYELISVLELPLSLRLSFVLRVLVGLPSQICAQELGVSVRDLSKCCWAAMTTLSAFDF